MLQSVGLTASGVIGIYVRVGGVICAAGIALGALYGVLFCENIGTIQRHVDISLYFHMGEWMVLSKIVGGSLGQ